MTVHETCVWHGSDFLAWVDRSGRVTPGEQRAVPERLHVVLDTAPDDLKIDHRPGRTVFHRKRPRALRVSVEGPGTTADRERPDVPLYSVAGLVTDPRGGILPRRFQTDVGNANGRALAVFRAPSRTHFSVAGGLFGRATYRADRTPAAGAVVVIVVDLPNGAPPLQFAGQADRLGNFRITLDRLPALLREAPVTTYDARVSLTADEQASRAWIANASQPPNPDQLPPRDICRTTSALTGNPISPVGALAIVIAPGTTARVTTENDSRNELVIH